MESSNNILSAGIQVLNLVNESVSDSLRVFVRNSTWFSVEKSVTESIRELVWHRVGDLVFTPAGNFIKDSTTDVTETINENLSRFSL